MQKVGRNVWSVIAGYSLGSYQNYADCGEETTEERLENYFGKKNFEQLKDLKYKYDPNGVLRKEHFQSENEIRV